MDSILDSVKKLLGISEEYEQFDQDVIMHVNSVFVVLNQLGIGPSTPFSISSNAETWSDFFGSDVDNAMVRSYVYLRVRMLFDPPTIGSVVEACNKQIDELTWRLMIAGDANANESDES